MSHRLSFGIDFILERNLKSGHLTSSRESVYSLDKSVDGLSSNGKLFSAKRDVAMTSPTSLAEAADDCATVTPLTSSTFGNAFSWIPTSWPITASEFSSNCQSTVVDLESSSSKRRLYRSQSAADVRHERVPPSPHEGSCALVRQTQLQEGELYNATAKNS